jgi:hypothetical protein
VKRVFESPNEPVRFRLVQVQYHHKLTLNSAWSEYLTHNEGVAGSNPAGSTMGGLYVVIFIGVMLVIRHFLGKGIR